MPLKRPFACPLPAGMHARPASALEEISRGFTSEITLINERSGGAANCKSVLSIVAADIRHNDSCTLTISGPDEAAAYAAVDAFIENELPHCDDEFPVVEAESYGCFHLPMLAQDAQMTVFPGRCAVAGVAIGRIVRAGGFKVPGELMQAASVNAESEWVKLDAGLNALTAAYDRKLSGGKLEAGLLKAHRAMARDPEFQAQLRESVLRRGKTAAGAIDETVKHFCKMLESTGNTLLQERVLDVQDVCRELLRQIYGSAIGGERAQLETDSIVLAETLGPAQFLAMDKGFLKGLALGQGGTTSHTVILARSFGIPTLTGIREVAAERFENHEAILDAEGGALLLNLTPRIRRYYAMDQRRLADRQNRLQKFTARGAAMRDGHPIEVGANVSSAEEAGAAFAAGADGLGLFRTEMLFAGRSSAPDEHEQYEIYRRALETAGGRPVIIRTLDAGADKPLEYLNLRPEENPFLGCRGVRLYEKFEPLIRAQIRALIRASAHGRLRLLLPMIATVDEARRVRKVISEEQQKCVAEKISFDAAMPVGAMIEVPSAVIMMDALGRELDFFSIGSNDLLQYFMAADRGNGGLQGLYDPLQPAFLRLLKQTVDAAHRNKKWIGLCGEAGANRQILPLLAGLGLDEISVSAPYIPGLKADLAELSFSDCEQALASAIGCATMSEVIEWLAEFAARRTTPLTESDLVIMNPDLHTKEEVIKAAADRLYVMGRTSDSRTVEEAIWRREQSYSTGFGHGFAIPHCKTGAIQSNSLVLLKLREPVAWNSLDDQPVRVAIVFAARDDAQGNSHMKVFAKLARLMMDEEFRNRIEKETDADALCRMICAPLE